MEQYKKEFIEFMIDCQVLKFGDFVTKSGRKTGYYRTGSQLKKLGEYYAKAIHESFGSDFDVLFGPAYKGIPLSVTTAIALSDEFDTDVRYCSNRKEVKDHGDVGILLGGPINDGDRVMMIEDVTTSDRMERGTGEKSAIAELEEKFGIRIRAIVTMQEVIEHLYNKPYKGKIIIDDTIKAAIDEYYKQYGAK